MGLFKRQRKDLFAVPTAGTEQDPVPVASFGFRMAVSDVFAITGRGTVVTGTVEAGSIAVGAPVIIERAGRPPLAVEVAAIEMFRKTTRHASAGDHVGLLLRGLTRTDITAGDVIRTG